MEFLKKFGTFLHHVSANQTTQRFKRLRRDFFIKYQNLLILTVNISRIISTFNYSFYRMFPLNEKNLVFYISSDFKPPFSHSEIVTYRMITSFLFVAIISKLTDIFNRRNVHSPCQSK